MIHKGNMWLGAGKGYFISCMTPMIDKTVILSSALIHYMGKYII